MQQLRSYLLPALLAVFVLLSAFSLWSQWSDANRMPSADEVTTINDVVLAEFAEGDAVRVLPNWFKDARVGLDDIRLIQTESLLNNLDFAHVNRLYVSYATAYKQDADDAVSYLTDVENLRSTKRMALVRGTVALPFSVTWDAVNSIRAADVARIGADGARFPCTRWVKDAWHCDQFNEWLHVGVRNREIDDTPRTCIVANPREFPEKWSVRWTEVPLGDRLRIRYGYTMWALRASRGSDLDFRVFINGEEVHQHTLEIDDFGYAYIEIPIAADAPPLGEIEVQNVAEDHFDRFFCFRLQTVEVR